MSLQKSEMKLLLLNDLGADIEDRLEAAKKSAYQLEGGAVALAQASKMISLQLCPKVDTLVEENAIREGMSVLEIAGLLKKYIIKCGDYVAHLSDCEKTKVVSQFGEVTGLHAAVKVLEKNREIERQKLSALISHQESGGNGESKSRPIGAHPGPSSLAQRRAEAKAEKEKKLVDSKPKKAPKVKKVPKKRSPKRKTVKRADG